MLTTAGRLLAGAGDLVAHGAATGMVVRQGMSVALWGMGAGLAGALPLARLLRTLLFGTTPFGPATFLGIPALLAAAALLACYLPARRATRVDPVVALRAD